MCWTALGTPLTSHTLSLPSLPVRYAPYCANHPAQLRILEARRADDAFQEELAAWHASDGSRLPLQSFLLKPVQRILKCVVIHSPACCHLTFELATHKERAGVRRVVLVCNQYTRLGTTATFTTTTATFSTTTSTTNHHTHHQPPHSPPPPSPHRYPLLVGELDKQAPEASALAASLIDTRAMLQTVAQDANKIKRRHELETLMAGDVMVVRGLTLADKLRAGGFEGDIAVLGPLLDEATGVGMVTVGRRLHSKRPKTRSLYLFKRALLSCKPDGDRRITVKKVGEVPYLPSS
jgi:hypothetical protein